MNDRDYGIALTSEKIVISNKAVFISPTVYTYIEEEFSFRDGGVTPVSVGDVARGLKSGATAIVVAVCPLMGTWEKSDVSGTIRIKSRSGYFIEGEGLSVGAEADRITLTSVPKECTDDYKYKGHLAQCVYISVPPSKDSLVDHKAVVIAVAGNTLDYNYMMGAIIPEAKKWVLYSEEIPKANFLSFVQGSKSTIDVIGYFN